MPRTTRYTHLDTHTHTPAKNGRIANARTLTNLVIGYLKISTNLSANKALKRINNPSSGS